MVLEHFLADAAFLGREGQKLLIIIGDAQLFRKLLCHKATAGTILPSNRDYGIRHRSFLTFQLNSMECMLIIAQTTRILQTKKDGGFIFAGVATREGLW